MNKFYTIIFLSLLTVFSYGQAQQVYVHFIPKVGGETLLQNTVVQNASGVEMSIDIFNYYVSNMHIIHDGAQDLDLSDTVFIVKMDDYTLDLGFLDITSISQINFGVGVPADKNHLDISLYPERHPLSYQTPSMHWGWTSGYALMIVEGMGDSSNDGVPETIFQFHNFGDANYQNVNLPTVATQTNESQLDIYVECNLDQWIYGQDPGTVGLLHGSSGVNASVMNNVESRSVFTTPMNAGVEKLDVNQGNLTAINSENDVTVMWSGVNNLSYYTLIDMNGKLIETSHTNLKEGKAVFNELASGTFIFTPFSSAGDKLNQLKFTK